jgi:saccharopine dehydrogenase-like NADP-dependent oxidoreductase
MKRILVLGAGYVARPLVQYLSELSDLTIVVADKNPQKAEQLVADSPAASSMGMDIADTRRLEEAIAGAHVVVSLLPWELHPQIAAHCLSQGRHLVTASYVKEEMEALDAPAREKGLLFLNEMGVDPGIDHMAAMKVIDTVKDAGGEIISYYAYCGGLPALENNNNPLGYKFSWSPEGAMLAATNDGRYLKDGKIIEIPGNRLFEHYWLTDIPHAGVFEAYVNRDALPYLKLYGIETANSVYRGTLRNIGYCETWDFFKKLGLLNPHMKFDLNELSPRRVIANMINSEGVNIQKEVAEYLCIPEYSLTLKKLEWLGLFSDQKMPLGITSVFSMFAHALKEKLTYSEGELDLLVQHHEFIARDHQKQKEIITSTLINTGIQGGDSSMSRTVGLPVAIAVKMIIEGKIRQRGVRIPVTREIYEPVLAELKTRGIEFDDQRKAIDA